MHFKNGRPAHKGDHVLTKDYNGQIVAGVIYRLTPGQESCNCDVAVLIPGGSQQLTCQSVGNMYHVEDGFQRLEDLAKVPDPVEKSRPVEAAPTAA